MSADESEANNSKAKNEQEDVKHIHYIGECNAETIELFSKVTDLFKNSFQGLTPDFLVRTPGRVNIIGEHIDYNGFGVCPVGLSQQIVAAVIVVPGEKFIEVVNYDAHKYKGFTSDVTNLKVPVDSSEDGVFWGNYLISGIKGIVEIVSRMEVDIKRGFKIAILGTIPPSAGLSSSSAIVCAGTMIAAFAYGFNRTSLELAQIAAASERFVGTCGGGMDHAAAFCSKKDKFLHVQFDPLKVEYYDKPGGMEFVALHSLGTCNKAASNKFNTRVAECRLATFVLAKKHFHDWSTIKTLSQLKERLFFDFKQMKEFVADSLNPTPYTKKEICELLDLTEEKLNEYLPNNAESVDEFKLRDRATHVIHEAARVEQFQVCSSATWGCRKLLMEDIFRMSQQSLSRYYECSDPSIEKLISICDNYYSKQGYHAARLTGAGWGGFIVAMVDESFVQQFISIMTKEFYKKRLPDLKDYSHLIFQVVPSEGAQIIIHPYEGFK